MHISSRAQDTSSSSATPVYNAFTARPAASNTSAVTDNNGSTHSSGTDLAHTFFSARDPPSHRSCDAKGSIRARPNTAPRSQPPLWAGSTFSEFASATLRPPSAIDTPRSEDVEELSNSLCALPPLDKLESTKTSLPIRLSSKARRAKSRSHHAHTFTSGAYGDAVSTHELPMSSFTGTPASLPLASGLGFLALQRNASVPSFANFPHPSSSAKEQSADNNEAGPSTSTSSGLLSRIASTRQLRRNKNMSAVDVESSASANWGGSETKIDSRSRSQSIGSIASKLRRSKDNMQAPPTPSKGGGKLTRSAAPPSAWRTDAAATAATGDVSSSAYSSDNEPSVGPASSSGHGVESGGGSASYQRHIKNVSSGDATTTTAQHPSPVLPSPLLPPSGGFGSLDASSFKRISTYSTRAATSPAAPAPQQLHLDRVNSSFDSLQVSGLPLPLPMFNPASPGETVFTQLLKRIGPPPVGLASESFDERVTLIKNYILNQLPLPLLPQSPQDEFAGYTLLSSRSGIVNGSHLHRSSLPTPPRHGNAYNGSTSLVDPSRLTTLQDEFDKLECLAEQELCKLAGPLLQQGNNREQVIGLFQDLRLEEAFLEARRRCGVDCSKSHFDLENFAKAHTRLLLDARPSAKVVNAAEALGLGLLGLGKTDEGVKARAAEMSLQPAPRRKRGVGAGRARRPITAPATGSSQALHSQFVAAHDSASPSATGQTTTTAVGTSLDYACPDLPTSIGFDGELLTPQSFSKPSVIARYRHPITIRTPFTEAELSTPQSSSSKLSTRPPSSNDTHSTNSSSHGSHTTHRTTAISTSSAIRSPPLFGHDLTRTFIAAGVDRVNEEEEGKSERLSEDTQLTDSDCYVGESAVGGGKGRRRMVDW